MKINKYLYISLLITLFNQISYTQSNYVGINLKFNDVSGLNSELRYEIRLAQRWRSGLSISTNFKNSNSFRIGMKYEIPLINTLSFLTGVDYNLRVIHPNMNENQINSEHNLEVPLELRYRLSNNFFILGGFSIPFSLEKNRQEDYLVNNLRTGIIKNF